MVKNDSPCVYAENQHLVSTDRFHWDYCHVIYSFAKCLAAFESEQQSGGLAADPAEPKCLLFDLYREKPACASTAHTRAVHKNACSSQPLSGMHRKLGQEFLSLHLISSVSSTY